jgi:hypothetical protein
MSYLTYSPATSKYPIRGFSNPNRVKSPDATGDPYEANVVLYLKGDGVNGSTTIIDDSPTPKAVSVVGNAQISTTESKYGGSSLFSSTTGYLTVSDSALNLSGSPFTIEFWINPTNIPVADYCGSRLTSNSGGWLFRGGSWYFIDDGWAARNIVLASAVWQHVAASYDGTDMRLFLDGVLKITRTFSYANTQSTVGIFSAADGANQSDNIYIDSLRITKGVARYTANFDPELDTFLAY